MRKIFSVLSLVLIFACTASDHASDDVSATHNAEPKKSLVGQIKKSDLLEAPFNVWYDKNYTSYTPDENSIKQLTESLNDFTVKVFMGTWCHDSKREVPRLLKILDAAGYDLENLNLVALNYSKQTPDKFEKGLDIQRTPTFIIFKDDAEVGRIVETPVESLEADLLKIITGQEYKHSYEK